jgi:CheY-like chemotaxis protein
MRKQNDPPKSPLRRILLICDKHDGLKVRKSVLETEGYEVVALQSAREGLERFAAESFDLVVTNYRMPEMNGTEVIQAVRAQRPDIRVVLVSGLVDVLGLTEQNTGADAVLQKTSTEHLNLTRTVNRLLRIKRKPAASSKPRGAAARRQTG